MLSGENHQSFQHVASWQEHFTLDQAYYSQFKERSKTFFAPPGAGEESGQKAKMFWLGAKIVIAIFLHDFVDVTVKHLALTIAVQDRQICDVELGSH